MEDVLEIGFYEYALGYDNVDWFVNEVIKKENKMTFYSKNTKKAIIMTQEDKEDFDNNSICRFVRKKYFLMKLESTVTWQVNIVDLLITLVI